MVYDLPFEIFATSSFQWNVFISLKFLMRVNCLWEITPIFISIIYIRVGQCILATNVLVALSLIEESALTPWETMSRWLHLSSQIAFLATVFECVLWSILYSNSLKLSNESYLRIKFYYFCWGLCFKPTFNCQI